MSQSNTIAGFLIAAFAIFITVRGELPSYIALFTGRPVNRQQMSSG